MCRRSVSMLVALGSAGISACSVRTRCDLAFEQQHHQIGFAHFRVADRRVGRCRVVVGVDHRAARMGAQPMQHGGEVGITREDDELVEIGVVREDIAHVHHDADVGRVLKQCGQRRTIDHLAARAQEMVAHEREGRHVGRVVALITPRYRIAVAAIDDDSARAICFGAVGRRHQAARFERLDPPPSILGEPLCRFLALALQRKVHVVVIDEDRRQNGSKRLPLHNRQPPAGRSSIRTCQHSLVSRADAASAVALRIGELHNKRLPPVR